MNINRNAQKNSERLRQPNIITTLRTDEQKGYGGACKAGFDLGESPYVCFLNSDCKIEDANWLRSMGETLLDLKLQGVRMVSPVMNNPVHGDPAQKGDKLTKEDPVIIANDSFLSLPCFLCHRELFKHVGGFLKEYQYGGYEDEEFAARLKKHGFKQAVCRRSYVYHKGESTIRTLWKTNPSTRKIMEEDNRQRCIEDMKSLK
jgi:GT2 family glycosyltransferase